MRRKTGLGQTGRLSISELQFQDWVMEVAQLHGWRRVHFRPAMVKRDGEIEYRTAYTGDDGFPDLVLARDGEVLVIECKTHTGKLGKGQQEWLDELGEHGRLFRPGMEAQILLVLSRPWKVQKTMDQRHLRLVDLLAMEDRARTVADTGDEVARATAAFILAR